MTNKELAQALRSAASALEHGRRRTATRKVSLVAAGIGLRKNDYTLMDGSAWFTVKRFSVRIRSTNEGIVCDVYKDGDEMADALASTSVFDAELK